MSTTKLLIHMDGDASSEIGGNDIFTKFLCHMGTVIGSNGSFENEDCVDISDWADSDGGSGVSSQTTFDSKSCFSFATGSAPGQAFRNIDAGSFGDFLVIETSLYCSSIGTVGNEDSFRFYVESSGLRFMVGFASDGLFIYDGSSWNEVGTDLVQTEIWQTWTFAIDFSTPASAVCEVYLDGVLQASAVDCSNTGSFTDGTVVLRQDGSTTSDHLTYMDYFKVGADYPLEDNSEQNHSITNNNVTVNTSIKKFGAGSAYFNGSSAKLTIQKLGLLEFGINDFTIDCWVKIPTDVTGYRIICSKGSTAGQGWLFGHCGAGRLRFWCITESGWNDYGYDTGTDLRDDSWHHIAAIRTGTSLKFYVDGTMESSQILNGSNIQSSTFNALIGAESNEGWYFEGYMDEIRISRGVQRWLSNFTPLTDEYGGHSLLPSGNPKLDSSIKKFGSSSMYFDGNSYIAAPDNTDWYFGAGDFTIDCWVRFSNSGTEEILFHQLQGTDNVFLEKRENNHILFGASDNDVSVGQFETDTAISTGQWVHFAFVRNGSNTYIFFDGISQSVTVDTSWGTLPDVAAPLNIGSNSTKTQPFTGYIDELRISKGTARWTENFTPPTAEYTTDEYTKLLLHFPGDISESAHQITFSGDTRIDVTPTKWSGVFYFDGSGDYLSIADNVDWNFADGDFTVDFWIRHTDLPSNSEYRSYIAQWNQAGVGNKSWRFYVYNNGGQQELHLDLSKDGSVETNVTYNWSPATQIWYHIAGVRDGDTIRLFLDGTQVQTTALTGSLYDSASILEIGSLNTTGDYFNGHMDEIRVVKGEAVWTSNFTPPTSPYILYALSGELSHETRIIILNENNWAIVENDLISESSYQYIFTTDDPLMIVGRKSTGQLLGYGNIIPS